ncbi:uncharacterized protein LOC135697786 [Ochlerotatus camptorhynchus]|uniref:uncharacterized protein LOC135697786 n=1 Tax=Ochlerotatus camptorhynchus TaxID=644619 RepID=UPI0031D9D9BC
MKSLIFLVVFLKVKIYRTAMCAISLNYFEFQIGLAEFFFGLDVQGGFKTETDISTAALAITAPFAALQPSIANLNKSLPLSTATLDDAARAIIFLYSGIVGPVDRFIKAMAESATDKFTFSTFLFDRIFVSLFTAQQFIDDTPQYISKVTELSSTLGGDISQQFNEIDSLMRDLSYTMAAFEDAVAAVSSNSQITPSSIYSVLNKYQLANLIGALNVFNYQITVLKSHMANVISIIMTSDGFMSSYTSTLTTAFASLDVSLTSSYNTITNVGASFVKKITNTVKQLSMAINNFRSQINAFTDNIINANATSIISQTEEFISFYIFFMNILKPNSEDKFNSVAYMVTDSVQTAARDILFNAYQTLNNAINNLPLKSSTCATTYLTPMVTSLSQNIPTLRTCLNLLDPQYVAYDQIALLNKLLSDRLYYVSLWTNAISGVTSYSSASNRKTAILKILAETPTGNVDVQTPALIATYSIFAQVVSNFNSLQNRVVMCLTLKSVDFSALVISASNSYFGCINK